MQRKVAKKNIYRLLSFNCAGNKAETACVDFDISIVPPTKRSDLALQLRIMFSKTIVPTFLGDVEITVKQCRLCFELTDATMPLCDRGMTAILPSSITKQVENASLRSNSTARTKESKTQGKFNTGGVEASADLGSSVNETVQEDNTRKSTFSLVDYSMFSGGTEVVPCWDFENASGEGPLKGTLAQQYLGKLALSGGSCRIHAKLTAYNRDVLIEGKSKFFLFPLSASAAAVRNLLFLNKLSKFTQPYLRQRCYEVKHDQCN
jgi:hypothetical protein